ncbi:hypothetical protein NDU88_001193 [Pleurodeles waltl]|uniref:Uncharacterized protein n=1 Tax=Pleurodeles waltl TaxID=8319 RepID=A0AAV7SBP0_PLEWA|nr:hypothetical protein NDU88_001193 [Pleurodeles waltl]
MYRPHHYNPPIRHLFRDGFTVDKNTAETAFAMGKCSPSTHPTRNDDSMDPDLEILPALVFLLLHDQQRRRRRRYR